MPTDLSRNIVKLIIALLKHQAENVLGKDAIGIAGDTLVDIGGEKIQGKIDAILNTSEGAQKLVDAALRADSYFREKCTDQDLRGAFTMSVGDLPSVQVMLKELPNALDQDGAVKTLRKNLASTFPNLKEEQIEYGATLYLDCLNRALLPLKDFTLPIIGRTVLESKVDIKDIKAKVEEVLRQIMQTKPESTGVALSRIGNAPPPPSLIIGRENDIQNLKERLKSISTTNKRALIVVRGWPGVGKTTIVSAIAHDRELTILFPDGTLWVHLGQTPNVLSELSAWGRALGTDELLHASSVGEASTRLTALLHDKRMLLIVDDVWESEHAIPFKVGGHKCAILFTTREPRVAEDLNLATPDDIYNLPKLTDTKSLELLEKRAPLVVAQNRKQCIQLVQELEGLPLALQVAGRLLNVEVGHNFGVTELLTELREGTKLLEAKAPSDRVDFATGTTPTVAVLLQKSTERLDDQTRKLFARLGAFAPKPATFDLAAMKFVWKVKDPKPTLRILIDRGLLERIEDTSRYWMHALLVVHAKSLLQRR